MDELEPHVAPATATTDCKNIDSEVTQNALAVAVTKKLRTIYVFSFFVTCLFVYLLLELAGSPAANSLHRQIYCDCRHNLMSLINFTLWRGVRPVGQAD